MNKINKELSAGANITPNGGINVNTGDSEITIATKDGQKPVTRKLFAYSKQSLITEKIIFWIYHGERVIWISCIRFENTDMYGQVVNFTLPSAGIHNFVFKWDMVRVSDRIPMQEYPTTIKITP